MEQQEDFYIHRRVRVQGMGRCAVHDGRDEEQLMPEILRQFRSGIPVTAN